MKRNILTVALLIGMISWSCSRIESPHGLKQSIEKSSSDINSAITKISGSIGYQLLSSAVDITKSDDGYSDSITLDLVSGIYEYDPDSVWHNNHFHPYKLFKKTGTSDRMIVSLPERMVFHPKYLYNHNESDAVLTNNFTISASDYHLFYDWWKNVDYRLSADLTLDSEDAGSIDISAVTNYYKSQSYSSNYIFPEGYAISAERQTGDTTISSFALSEDDNILLKESVIFIWKEHHKHEKQYILTIGNVDIKRTKGVDSIEVYLDGVLQQEAAAYITDDDETSGSICHKRDILLTFDDGTTAKISEMIDPAITTIRTLVDSLQNMYFAKHIVDYIAMSIYYFDS
jgi:hypothetical protein